ncbi:MAG: Nramp family divalent metal transporter [Oligoflexia bacterium]|nr:Nramp family divalent metal transporter [Oligoflexia bacterium]MBF0365357.1 Nramp family divalent metal transporter [Oligoflexia bacterium]
MDRWISVNPWLQKLLMFLSVIGPGIITANIDNDAGGIATYSLAGSATGFRLLWVIPLIAASLILVQEMSARLGIVTEKGLADLIRERYGLKITFYMFICLIIADLGNTMAEFAGIASAGEIFGISKYITVPVCAVAVWLLVLKGNYRIVEKVFMCGCLVYISYVVCGLVMAPPWQEIFHAMLVPNIREIRPSDWSIIVGLIGTSITPWMQFYIQASIVEKGVAPEELLLSRMDVFFGCLMMSLVSMFIIICCASTIFPSGVEVQNAKDAALALGPLAGHNASILFAIGLFNASFFSAALLPLATSYYVCEGMGLESGVNKTFGEAPHFFSIFTILIVASVIMVLIPNIGLFKILIWSQVLNGLLIPLILIFIVRLASDKELMGSYCNTFWYNLFAYIIIGLMLSSNVALLYHGFR